MSVAALITLTCALWAQAPHSPLLPAAPPPRELPRAAVRALTPIALFLDIRLPDGARLDPKTAFQYSIVETRGAVTLDMATRRGEVLKPKLPIRISLRAPEGLSELTLYVAFTSCPKLGACSAQSALYRMVLEGRKDARRTKVPVIIAAD